MHLPLVVLLGLVSVFSRTGVVDAFGVKGATPGFSLFPQSTTNNKDGTTNVIEAAQKVMANTGYFSPMDASLFADDFIFRGPAIGPLNKSDYQSVLEYFSVYKAFPDLNPNCFGYNVDPEDPLRVWLMVRATGTYTQPLGGALGKLAPPPDSRPYRGSTETWSLLFDADLKCRLMTAGYVSDRFDSAATTNGIGLTFGILETLGLSLPSAVGDPRLRLIQAVNGPLEASGMTPKAVSAPKDIPTWWESSKRGADP